MKGFLYDLALEFIKRGYTVYGWSNKFYYPYSQEQYNDIVIGKPDNPNIISINYDSYGNIYTSKIYIPTIRMGSAARVDYHVHENTPIQEIIDKVYNAPLPKFVDGIRFYKDVDDWYEHNKKWNQFEKMIENGDKRENLQN